MLPWQMMKPVDKKWVKHSPLLDLSVCANAVLTTCQIECKHKLSPKKHEFFSVIITDAGLKVCPSAS